MTCPARARDGRQPRPGPWPGSRGGPGRTATPSASGLPSRRRAPAAGPSPAATASWLPAGCLTTGSRGPDPPGKPPGNPGHRGHPGTARRGLAVTAARDPEMTASCKPDYPCSGTRPAHPVLPANAGHPEDGVAPRAQAATATPDRTTPPAPRQPAQPAARETKARRDRKICGAQNTGISASAPTETESAARAATCAGSKRFPSLCQSVPQTRTIRPSLTSLHNYA